MASNQQVFVLSTEGRDSGTPDYGSIVVNRGALPYTPNFALRLTSFNMVFTPPNVSPLKGNTVKVDNGTATATVILPTGSYGVGGSNDIGEALVKLMNDTLGGGFTSSYDEATNRYTFSGTTAFKFIWQDNLATVLGFDRNEVLTLATSHTGKKLPKFYDNTFLVTIEADNATTQLVKIPRGKEGIITCSFVIPRTVDFGEQIYLTQSEIAPQRILFATQPVSLTWRLTRPNSQPLEQEYDWTAVFAIEP